MNRREMLRRTAKLKQSRWVFAEKHMCSDLAELPGRVRMEIAAVSFDLWFTLVWEKEEDVKVYESMRVGSILEVLRSRGIDVDYSRVLDVYRSLGHARMLLSSREVSSIVLTSLGVRADEELVEKLALAYELSTENFKPRENPEAAEALSRIKSLGLKVAVVSNTSFSAGGVRALLKNTGLSEYVDVIVSSSDVGHLKPQRRIFMRLAEVLGVEPGAILHVGDSCVEDVIGALSSGLRAAYYIGLLSLRGADPSELCLALAPTVKSLREIVRLLS